MCGGYGEPNGPESCIEPLKEIELGGQRYRLVPITSYEGEPNDRTP